MIDRFQPDVAFHRLVSWSGVASLIALFACSASRPAGAEATLQTHKTPSGVEFRVEEVARNLEIPWSIVFAPDGRVFVTERPGRVRVLVDGKLRPEPMIEIGEVRHIGEGGLMGLAIDPSFGSNKFVYVAYTYQGREGLGNRVVRYKEDSGKLVSPVVIVDSLPGARFHDGCRLRFGPDGKLYVTTGDATQRTLAQEMKSLAGKILRVNADGSVPSDNPFPGSPVYSLGHRNAQGIDWHPVTKLLFCTEHGPSGFDGPGGGDEVNLVEVGNNYGWPVIHHRESKDGMVPPLLEFTPAIGPSGGSFYRGDRVPAFKNNFFFTALRGRHISRVVLKAPDYRQVELNERLLEDVFGRIRDVVEGPDGALYFCTNNRDGRGSPHETDDRIMRIVPVK